MEVRQLTATTATLEVAYEESGPASGLPVILLHGFPYDVRQYDAVRDQLVQSGHRVLVPYLRGFGPTRYRDQHIFRSGQQAALGKDVIDLLDALGIPQAVLVGYDWGGRNPGLHFNRLHELHLSHYVSLHPIQSRHSERA